MHIVDRPRPTNHEYKSVRFTVRFTWGQPDSPIPLSGWVQIESKPNQALHFHPSAPWNSIDEAKDDVVAQTKKAIDADNP